MSPGAPEMNAADLIARISRGELPRDFMMFAAQGMLPLPQDELVAVLAHLAHNADAQIADTARTSIGDLPPRVVLSFCRAEDSTPEQLSALAAATHDSAILEAIVRNRNTSDETVERLAGSGASAIQEVIVINQERILRTPAILDALLANPQLSADVRRRALETREEFFEKKARIAVVSDGVIDVADDIDMGPIEELLVRAETEPQPENSLPPPPGMEEALEAAAAEAVDDDKLSVWARISKMSISERVQVAYKGGKTERGILVRDRNKLVCSAVVRSPRITESEIESFAGMRNVEDDVLRIIASSREYMSKYGIMHTLIKNPKCPIALVLPLIGRLTNKDLKILTTDRGVSEAVRSQARRLFQSRNQKN